MNDSRDTKDLSVKDALAADLAALKLRSTVIIDPAPLPYIPVTPIVIGKKALTCMKKAVISVLKNND